MRPSRPANSAVILAAVAALVCAQSRADVIVTEGAGFGLDVSPVHGRIAFDIMGTIWTLPPNGGQATQMTDGMMTASSPRWSPDGSRILFQARGSAGTELWQLDPSSREVTRLSDPDVHNQNASWHPAGDRIAYSSERNDTGLDIWETDLPTGLSWRISDRAGDETEPAWSDNGRHLAYIHRSADRFALVLRRHGEPEQELVVSSTRLSSPSWRPDGSLLTYQRHDTNGVTLEMVILSDPPLVRVFAAGEDYFSSPVSWRDRNRLYYTADGAIKTRRFEDRRARPLPFRAVVQSEEPSAPRTVPNRQLAVENAPRDRLVIRGARLFDGIWSGYREKMDVLIEGGLVIAVEPRKDWPDVQVLDLGDVAVMPGLIDSWSAAPADIGVGPAILAYGVTTIVADATEMTFDRLEWEGEQLPGPRVLPAAAVTSAAAIPDDPEYFLVNFRPAAASIDENRQAVESWRAQGVPIVAGNWTIGKQLGVDILLGADVLPGAAQQAGIQGEPGVPLAANATPAILISGLADGGTPGIAALLASRQAIALHAGSRPARRIAVPPQLAATSATIVAGGGPNGLAPGLGLHAELRALQAAGLSAERAMQTAGKNAAAMLGLDNQVGTITPGAMADFVLVRGDPLTSVNDLLNIVAVVRNGRFYSLVSLLEKAGNPVSVE